MIEIMKSIYLISNARVCGPVNQAINITSGLREFCDFDTSIVTLSPEINGNSWMNRIDEAKIPHFCLNTSKIQIFKAILKLRKYVRDNDVEIIHSSGFRANLVASMMHKKYRKISTQRCSPDDIGEKLPKLIRPIITKIYLWIIDKLDVNVTCSKSLQDIFDNKFNRKYDCIPNCVNTTYFEPISAKDKSLLQQKVGIDNTKKTFLILGSLRPRKDNITAIKSFNDLLNYNVQCIIVGSGPEMDFLKSQSKNPNVHFFGGTTEPIKYLQASDCLISCSLAEGLPNTVLEAISCGLPCILSDIGPHKEIIENTQAGILFRVKDIECLKKCIIGATEWTEFENKAARELANQKFSRQTLAKRYAKVYLS